MAAREGCRSPRSQSTWLVWLPVRAAPRSYLSRPQRTMHSTPSQLPSGAAQQPTATSVQPHARHSAAARDSRPRSTQHRSTHRDRDGRSGVPYYAARELLPGEEVGGQTRALPSSQGSASASPRRDPRVVDVERATGVFDSLDALNSTLLLLHGLMRAFFRVFWRPKLWCLPRQWSSLPGVGRRARPCRRSCCCCTG